MTGADWPEADARFRADPRWLGGDDGYTVHLGGDRTLWLFGDTFIAEAGQTRSDTDVVHSSIALQTGLDLATCDFHFDWRRTPDGRPLSLVETGDETWLWPGDGLLVDGRLLLFFMHVRSTRPDLDGMDAAWEAEGSMGFFEVFGWQAFVVLDPQKDLADWQFEPVTRPDVSHGSVIGTAVIEYGDHVLAYCYTADGALLARWKRATAAAGDLSEPEWWCEDGWGAQGRPVVVLPDALTEFTVHRGDASRWVLTEVTGFAEPEAAVSLRFADQPEGPWSASTPVHPLRDRPPGAVIYAGKAHPELAGPGLVVSHVTIGMTRDETLRNRELYVPRVVCVPRP
ncbi:MAG: hypothetical protein QOK42_635 [Frankiaceae bacterium]|nr:hypothetical protein [Frankiaceae bacterium]